MKIVCEKDKCCACGACVNICPKEAVQIKTDYTNCVAEIAEEKCIGCHACERVCPAIDPPALKKPVLWKQGWIRDEKLREASTSGGAAKALSLAVLEEGGCVCSCGFSEGNFIFSIAENKEELSAFTGSKYSKSDMGLMMRQIRKRLTDGQKVLVIGLPCQCAGVRNYIPEDLQKNLILADLICHGSPSKQHLEHFLKGRGTELSETGRITFRSENAYQLIIDGRPVEPAGVYDPYTLAFLNRINYTENCYQCPYARLERVSDLTLGDSWGSTLPEDEKKKGISLILCQSEKGKELLSHADMQLTDVDLANAAANNHQLEKPSLKPRKYAEFMGILEKGGTYDEAVRKSLFRTYVNQKVKKVLRRNRKNN